MVAEGEPYRVCIAVGYGAVLNNGALGVMGDEMNIVAKLAEDIATAGETLQTKAGGDSLRRRVRLPLEKLDYTISNFTVTAFRLQA